MADDDPWADLPAVEEGPAPRGGGRRHLRPPLGHSRPGPPVPPGRLPAPPGQPPGRPPRRRLRWRWLVAGAAAATAVGAIAASTGLPGTGPPASARNPRDRPPSTTSQAAGGPQVIISPPGGGATSGLDSASTLSPAGFMGPQVTFSGGNAWLITNLSLYESTDGGLTWRMAVAGDSPLGEPLEVGFWNAAGGWLTTESADGAEQLYLTSDQGAHWRRTSAPFGTVWAQFADGRHGWALDGRATLYRTADGGRTWRPVATPGPLNTACTLGPGSVVGVVEGRHAEVVQTTDGGWRWRSVYRLPGPVMNGSPVAVCSPSSPTAVVAFARAGAFQSNGEAFAGGQGSDWRWLGQEPGQQGLGVATGPGGSVVAAYQVAGSLIVYGSNGQTPMRLSARLALPGEPPGGTAQAGVGGGGRALVTLTCGTTVYAGISDDGGAAWVLRDGRLNDPGENTNPSC